MSLVRVFAFGLLRVHLFEVGPIRELEAFSFLTRTGPANLAVVMGRNGSGKTSVVEAVFVAMSMLGGRSHPRFGLEELDGDDGAVQLDVRLQVSVDARMETVVLSIVLNSSPLVVYAPEELDTVEASRQVTVVFNRQQNRTVAVASYSDPLAMELVDAIAAAAGEPAATLFGQDLELPTVLYFPTMRGIARPEGRDRSITRPANLEYRPSQRFGMDGGDWRSSLDNLFVWYTWMDDGRMDLCRGLVNDLVFAGRTKRLGEVNRRDLHMRIETEDSRHRIDQLSHGERQLLELVVRVASHMTRCTVVLIDEAELHLHLVFRRRLMVLLKRWAVEFPGLTLVMTSHQVDMLRVFGPKTPESGLRKGGFLMKTRRRSGA